MSHGSNTSSYRVEFIRYGALLYYHAATLDEAHRFIELYSELGEIEVKDIVAPDGTVLDHPQDPEDLAV